MAWSPGSAKRVGIGCERGAAAGGPQRLGEPATGPRRKYRATPDQGLGVGQTHSKILGRILRNIGEWRALLGHLVHGVGDRCGWTSGPSCMACKPSRTTIAAASGSAVAVGNTMLDREAACSAIIEGCGHAISSWEPRRTASCTVAIRPAGALSLAMTTTRSRAPTQPGRPWVGHATNGTGQTGSSIARMKRASVPAAITALGRGNPCSSAYRLCRIGGLASDAGSGFSQAAQDRDPPRPAPADRPARSR